jgi:hypothetical protein
MLALLLLFVNFSLTQWTRFHSRENLISMMDGIRRKTTEKVWHKGWLKERGGRIRGPLAGLFQGLLH